MPRGETLSRRWQLEPAPDDAVAALLAGNLGVPLPFARLLVQRDCATVEAARRFLRPSRHDLCDPLRLPDMDRALHRLVDAVRRGEVIFLHGDYDVDGQCAVALLTRLLAVAGGRAVPFIPHRLRDGYDLTAAGVGAAAAAGARVIVTLDCGTGAAEAVALARRSGMDVIVVDHHLPGPARPDALALVNPRRPDSGYPFADLCGAGVAWKLAVALAGALGVAEGGPWHFLDLVALATVADLVPLVGENRILVSLGLRVMGRTRWPGLAALIAAAGLGGKTLRAGHLGFVLGPRLNAAGRVGEPMEGLRLLLTDDPGEAAVLAAQLERLNAERQALDQRTLDEALGELDAGYDPVRDVGVVIARQGWHPGVIGIVASRIVERIARPTVLVALDGELGKGSGRSVARCDLHAALARCAPHLERWGGHRMAAGLTVRRDRLEAFRAAFNDACAAQVAVSDLRPTQRIDAVLGLPELSDEFERRLRALEPTGIGNPGPVFGLEGLSVAGPMRGLGDRHVRLQLTDGRHTLRTVAWGAREEVERVVRAARSPLRAAVRLERDTYGGRDLLEGRLVALAGE
ncbi:MAG: single-stranded-DNA-specific exonuclease RecJ [Gemmatimonadetes bacterium]|nr:single-stranded-DNA-specific exonuclease RecJ [Gemmatimonadota bacterium]